MVMFWLNIYDISSKPVKINTDIVIFKTRIHFVCDLKVRVTFYNCISLGFSFNFMCVFSFHS